MTLQATPSQRFANLDEWLGQFPARRAASLARKRDELVQLFRDPLRSDLRWWRRVGVRLVDITSAAESSYGAGIIELLVDEVAPSRARSDKTLVTQFYQFRDFARSYSAKEAAQLAARVRNGEIMPQHVACLLTVREGNQKTMAEFLHLAIEHRLTVNALRRAIQDDKRAGLRRYGGRRPKPRTKSNPALAARDITVVARRWIACHSVYFGDGGPLTKIPKKATEGLLRELEAALGAVQQVSRAASEAERVLSPLVKSARAMVEQQSARRGR